jgi:hypothetical protein
VHGHRLANDEAIADQFSDRLSRVGIGDFVDFVGVEPDLAFAAADDGRREALLGGEVGPKWNLVQLSSSLNRLMKNTTDWR